MSDTLPPGEHNEGSNSPASPEPRESAEPGSGPAIAPSGDVGTERPGEAAPPQPPAPSLDPSPTPPPVAPETVSATTDDPPRYCLRCHSRLSTHRDRLDSPRCEQCDLPYDPANPATYHRRRMFLGWKLWLPGLLWAILAGVISYVITYWLDAKHNTMGFSLFVVVPLTVGTILGYMTRPRFWLALLLSLLAITCIVFVIISMNLAGIFCGVTLGLVFLLPTLFGCGAGWLLRRLLKGGFGDHRRYYCVALLSLLPLLSDAVENQFPPETATAEVSTSATFAATPRQAWKSMVFYEQVRHAPPWLLTLALPRPVRSEGRKTKVGSLVRCIYRKGYLVKRIIRVEPEKLLVFQVTEQHLHFEHDVTLQDGSFLLEPVDPQHVRVVLTTRYRRHLRPAFIWQPMEQEVIHTMHDYILSGMRLRLHGSVAPKAAHIPQMPARGTA